MKRFFFWIIAFLPLLIFIEVSSLLLLNFIPTRIRERANYRVAADYIEAARKAALGAPQIESPTGECRETGQQCVNRRIFSEKLGWSYPPYFVFQDQQGIIYRHGQFGERLTCTYYASDLIASYGDSFTHCNEVKDTATWQTFLAHKLGKNVLNFGVAGYGPDQAVLLYGAHYNIAPKTPIVMLCIFPENINRIVNVYRNFYMYRDPLSLTKPRFVISDGNVKLLENPVRSVKELDKLLEPSFVERVGVNDYWYQLGRRLPPIRFPYTFSLFRWREIVTINVKASLCRAAPRVFPPTFNLDLYAEPEPFATMCGVVDRFVETAVQREEYPIIAVIPHTDYVREVLETGGTRTDRLISYMKKKNYVVFDLVRAMADLKPSLAQLDTWYQGHATVEGNRITADLIHRLLKEHAKADLRLEKLLRFPAELE